MGHPVQPDPPVNLDQHLAAAVQALPKHSEMRETVLHLVAAITFISGVQDVSAEVTLKLAQHLEAITSKYESPVNWYEGRTDAFAKEAARRAILAEYAQSLLNVLDSYGTDRQGPIPVAKVIQILEDTVRSNKETS